MIRNMIDGKEGNETLTKTISLFFLLTNDNLGNIITQVYLKGDNYDEWARAIKTTLQAKKFGFIDG